MLRWLRRFSVWVGLVMATTGVATSQDARLELLRRLVQDESPAVRVEALRGLAKLQSAEAAALALGVLDRPMDPKLDYALWLTINDLAEPWIAAVESGAWKAEGRERQLEFALKALKPAQAGRLLETVLVDSTPLPRDGSGPWVEVIGAAGAPVHLQRLLDRAVGGSFDPAGTARVLKALGQAARLRNQRPTGNLAVIGGFLRSLSPAIRIEAARLAGLWKDIGAGLAVLTDERAVAADISPEERSAVFEALRQIGGESVITALRKMVEAEGKDPAVRREAAVTLAALDGLAGFPAAIEVAGSLGDEATATSFWRGVLGIKGSALPVREALESRKLPEAVARAGMKVAREGGRDDIELVTAFARAGGLEVDSGELTRELLMELASQAQAKGDPYAGQYVYRRQELACMTCHAVGGAGGKVGPDLTSIGASAPMDYLVEALLLPNAKIKEGYHSVVIQTRDGEEYTGTLARETQEEVVLRDASGHERAVAKSQILEREIGRLSLMPAALIEPLSSKERLDLFAFLGRLGKPGDFDASRGGVARRWRVGNVIHTDVQNNQADWYLEKPLTDKRWVDVYTLANGDVSPEILEAAVKAQPWTSKVAVVLATEMDHASASPVRFRSNAAKGELWAGGRKLGSGTEVVGELPAGRHRVILKFDPREVPEKVHLEAEGAVFLFD